MSLPRAFAILIPAVSGLAILGMAACTPGIELPGRSDDGAGPAPQLLPLSGILAQAAGASDMGRDMRLERAAAPLARAASLRARAERLRGPVIAGAERARMLASAQRVR